MLADEGFRLCTYKSGENVFTPESYEKSFGVVVSGSVSISKGNRASSVLMKKTSVGGGFGAAALFGNVLQYASTIRATSSQTTVALISEAAMVRLIEREPKIAISYIGFLSDRIRYLNSKIDTFATGNAGQRLIRFLLAEAPCEISMQGLSQLLGVSRVTLYREMEKLEQADLVKRDGKCICVADKELLEKNL